MPQHLRSSTIYDPDLSLSQFKAHLFRAGRCCGAALNPWRGASPRLVCLNKKSLDRQGIDQRAPS
jgi:hypothetical protein